MGSDGGDSLSATSTASGYVRCVSGTAPPANQYTDRDDGTVYDRGTNLLWLKCPLQGFGPPGVPNNNTACTTAAAALGVWSEALNACDQLTFAGRTDWRLPSVRELGTLLAYDRSTNPYIDLSFFPSTPSGSHWSSTADDANNTNAWRVSFNNLDVQTLTKGTGVYARCVATGL